MMQRTYDEPTLMDASESHMACLLLLDTSGSMAGSPIEELNNGLNRFRNEVCEDPKTKSVLDVAIVEFNSEVSVVQEFDSILNMKDVHLAARGGTSMGAGLRTAIQMVDDRYRLYRRAGTEPYKPWIVMISDGEPTDSIEGLSAELAQLEEEGKLKLWCLAVRGANTELLYSLTKRVFEIDGYDFTNFFDWVNKSMRTVSVSSPTEDVVLPDIEGNLKVADRKLPSDW